MAPPQVRDLQSVISQVGQSVNPMKQQIDSDIAANETYGKAQEAGLEAKKNTAFGQITQNAQDKNMFFSGLSADDQAKYTADTYMPALAALQQTIAQTRSGLMKEKLGLDKDVFDKSWGSVEQDRAVLADWNKMTAQQQFDASEADKQRVWQAQQNDKDRSTSLTSASIGASSRSGGGGGGSSNDPTPNQNMSSALATFAGGDGFVSPGDWQRNKSQWVAGGYGDAASFDSQFASFKNPKNKNYK